MTSDLHVRPTVADPADTEPAPVPAGLTVLLWTVLLADAGAGAWLAAVHTGSVACTGIACTISTWGHPDLLLVLAGACAVTMSALAVLSRAFSRFPAWTVPPAVAGTLCGLAAVSGVVALFVLTAVIVLIGSVLLVALVDGI